MTQAPRRDLSVPLPVRVTLADASERHEYVVNVSATGLCLHVRCPMGVGEPVAVAFQLPSDEVTIEARCKVVWTAYAEATDPLPHFFETGLSMLEIDEDHRKRLAAFVEAQVDRR